MNLRQAQSGEHTICQSRLVIFATWLPLRTMTSIRSLFVFILATLLLALPSRSQTVVDLSQNDTLLPFFKAGLHPRNRKGFEMDYCKLPNQTTIQPERRD